MHSQAVILCPADIAIHLAPASSGPVRTFGLSQTGPALPSRPLTNPIWRPWLHRCSPSFLDLFPSIRWFDQCNQAPRNNLKDEDICQQNIPSFFMVEHSKTLWYGLIFLSLPNKQSAVSLRVQMTAMPTHYSPFLPPTSPILPISPHSHSLSPRWPATSDGRHNSGCTRDMLPINRILISREIWSTKVKVRAKVRLCQLPLLVLPVVECGQPSKQWHHTVSLLLNYDQEWTKMLNILYDIGNNSIHWRARGLCRCISAGAVSAFYTHVRHLMLKGVSYANFGRFMQCFGPYFSCVLFSLFMFLHDWLAVSLILLCSLTFSDKTYLLKGCGSATHSWIKVMK